MIDRQFLLNLFRYHPPVDQDQRMRYETIRERGLYFAEYINENVPDGHEKSMAVDRIREAVMWANAGIACNEAPNPVAYTAPLPIEQSVLETKPDHPSFPEAFRGGQ